MKKIKRIGIVLLALTLTSGTLVGCRSNRGDDREINENCTQLRVGLFDGGYGSDWIDAAIERFEYKYRDVSFEEGKMGIQVLVDTDAKYSGSIAAKIPAWSQHIVICENMDYYSMVSKKRLIDISDVVNTPLNYDFITDSLDPSSDETDTIGSIMDPSMSAFFKQNTTDKYYGIPFCEGIFGIIYDMDVFDEYGFYYAADGYGDAAGFVQDVNGNWIGKNGAVVGRAAEMTLNQAIEAGVKLSNGVDGAAGGKDDGLPATYDEYFALCERIEARGLQSLIWPGEGDCQWYMNYLAYNLWADYEGAEQMALNYNFSGTATDLIDMDTINEADGTFATYSQEITNANGYLLNAQAGKYYAIDFMKRLTSSEKYYDERYSFNDSINQVASQKQFLLSALPSQKRIAMMVDGSWWQNEAKNTFNDMVNEYGGQYSLENRRFGFMPLPKATSEKVGTETVRVCYTATMFGINAAQFQGDDYNEKLLAAAKQFIKFCHTHESLYEFTKITMTAKPYAYTLTDSEYGSLNDTAKSNYDMHTSANWLFSYSQNPIAKAFPSDFNINGYVFNSGMNDCLTRAFYENPSLTSWSYFKTMVEEHSQSAWEQKYAVYI